MVPVAQETTANTVRLPYSFSRRFGLVAWCEASLEIDLSTLAQLLSGFSGTAVGVVKGDWMALVQAVKNDSSSNVLSTPSITTLDNQEAFFMVGQDVPVLTGSTVGSNNSNPFNTVERKKVGIMLKVTPQINEGNAVQMVIEQEVSKVEGQTSLDVVFGERKLKTTVLANDGELIDQQRYEYR